MLFAAAVFLALPAAAAEGLRVLVVLSQTGGPYAEAAAALADNLPSATIRPIDWHAVDATAVGSDVVVAIGSEAAEAVATKGPRLPTVNLLVPRSVNEQLTASRRREDPGCCTAVYLDQPIGRQLDLIRLALPERKYVGVLIGPESRDALPQLQASAEHRGLTLVAARADGLDNLAGALQQVSTSARVLLTLPDRRLLNASTVRDILLSAYRADLPVVGFSPAYARAGAMLVLFATPEQMGRQAAELLRQWPRGHPLPPPQYSNEFKVETNVAVAESLGFRLPSAAELTERLRKDFR